MSPHPLDHNIRTFESYNRTPARTGRINEGKFLSKIGRGLNRIGQKLFGKQKTERQELQNNYQHEQQGVHAQCQAQMNAIRQEMGQTAPAAYAAPSAVQASPDQATPAPASPYPSTWEAPPTPSPSTTPATPSPETSPSTTPPSPPNTGTETGDYIAGQESAKQSEREAKYPSSEWPTNLWKGPHGLWVSGLPEDGNTDVLRKQYQNLRNSGVTTVFSIIGDGLDSKHQQAAQAAGLRLEKVNIYESDKIANALARGEQCLVHCRGGQHRAPTTAANAYLKAGKATSIDQAFRMAGGRLENFFGGAEGQVYPEGQEELVKLVEQAKKAGISIEGSEIVNRLRTSGFTV